MAREPKHDGTSVIVWSENGVERRCVPSPNHDIESVAERMVPDGVKWSVEPIKPHNRRPSEAVAAPVTVGGVVVKPLPADATLPQLTEKVNDLVRALSQKGDAWPTSEP